MYFVFCIKYNISTYHWNLVCFYSDLLEWVKPCNDLITFSLVAIQVPDTDIWIKLGIRPQVRIAHLLFCHIEPMTSKVQSAADYRTIDVKMTSKVQPAEDYWIIDVKDHWIIDRENLGTRLCHSTKAERNGREDSFQIWAKKIFWINNKAIIESVFAGYEEFCRSRRVLSTEAETLNPWLLNREIVGSYHKVCIQWWI